MMEVLFELGRVGKVYFEVIFEARVERGGGGGSDMNI